MTDHRLSLTGPATIDGTPTSSATVLARDVSAIATDGPLTIDVAPVGPDERSPDLEGVLLDLAGADGHTMPLLDYLALAVADIPVEAWSRTPLRRGTSEHNIERNARRVRRQLDD